MALHGEPRNAAICVQRFDDSLSPAIHTTYRDSLRSSSLWKPRDPSSRGLFVLWLAPYFTAPGSLGIVLGLKGLGVPTSHFVRDQQAGNHRQRIFALRGLKGSALAQIYSLRSQPPPVLRLRSVRIFRLPSYYTQIRGVCR